MKPSYVEPEYRGTCLYVEWRKTWTKISSSFDINTKTNNITLLLEFGNTHN